MASLRQIFLGLCAAALSLGAFAQDTTTVAGGKPALDTKAGRDFFVTCAGCHAVPGLTNVYPTYNVPRLGGQHPQFVINALTGYVNGERAHSTMKANAVNLTDEMKQSIADYLYTAVKSSDNRNIVTGDPDAGFELIKGAICASCHGAKGEAAEGGMFPMLAGQYESYLLYSLKGYRDGTRTNPSMIGQIKPEWTDKDLLNIAAYFASQKGLTTVKFK